MQLTAAFKKRLIISACVLILLGLVLLFINPSKRIKIDTLIKKRIAFFIDNSISFRKDGEKFIRLLKDEIDTDNLEVTYYTFGRFLRPVNDLGDVDFTEHSSYFSPVYNFLSTYKKEDPVYIISDYNFRDDFLRIKSDTVHYVTAAEGKEIGEGRYDVSVDIEADEYNLEAGMSNALEIKMFKNFKANVLCTLVYTINKKRHTRNITLKGRETSHFVTFVPENNTYYTVQARVQAGNKKFDSIRNNNTVQKVFFSKKRELFFTIYTGFPDYEVSFFKKFLDRYTIFNYTAYNVFKKNRKIIKPEKDHVAVLFSPDKEVFEALEDHPVIIYFPLKSASLLKSIFRGRYVHSLQSSDVNYAHFDYSFNFLNLGKSPEESKEIWRKFPEFKSLHFLSVDDSTLPFYNDNNKSFFLKRDNIYFIGCYPLWKIYFFTKGYTSRGDYYDNLMYNFLIYLHSHMNVEKDISVNRNNLFLHEKLVINSKNIPYELHHSENGRNDFIYGSKKSVKIDIDREGTYELSFKSGSTRSIIPLASTVPIGERYNPLTINTNALFLQDEEAFKKAISDIKKAKYNVVEKEKYFFILNNLPFMIFMLLLFIIFSVLKKLKEEWQKK
ncbi:hypothetical protein ACFL6D_03525 [Spirochaetota bacterium]